MCDHRDDRPGARSKRVVYEAQRDDSGKRSRRLSDPRNGGEWIVRDNERTAPSMQRRTAAAGIVLHYCTFSTQYPLDLPLQIRGFGKASCLLLCVLGTDGFERGMCEGMCKGMCARALQPCATIRTAKWTCPRNPAVQSGPIVYGTRKPEARSLVHCRLVLRCTCAYLSTYLVKFR